MTYESYFMNFSCIHNHNSFYCIYGIIDIFSRHYLDVSLANTRATMLVYIIASMKRTENCNGVFQKSIVVMAFLRYAEIAVASI
jgi:hypothetical protein